MDDQHPRMPWLHRVDRGRAAASLPLLLALALGAAACAETVQPAPDPRGGKADTPQPTAADIAASTMQVLPERPGLVDVVRDPTHRWFARLIGPQGEIFLTSTDHAEETSAINAILGIKENGVLPERYRVMAGSGGGCAFELRAANHVVIARSRSFADCDAAAASAEATRALIAGVVQFEAAVAGGASFALWRAPTDRKWYFAMRAEDQSALLESQPYSRRLDAVNGIASVRENGKRPERYRLLAAADGSVAVSLRATNGREIARSGPHPAAEQAEAVIAQSVALLRSERVGNPW